MHAFVEVEETSEQSFDEEETKPRCDLWNQACSTKATFRWFFSVLLDSYVFCKHARIKTELRKEGEREDRKRGIYKQEVSNDSRSNLAGKQKTSAVDMYNTKKNFASFYRGKW